MSKSKSKLGDIRLDRVHGLLVHAMAQKQTIVLRRLAKDKSEEAAFGRFLKNPKITPSRIVDHFHHVSPQDFTGKHILLLEDSSSASFGLHANRTDLGYISQNTNKSGFLLHPAIYMDAKDGACYGLGGLTVWKTPFREKKKGEPARRDQHYKIYHKIPFKDKERYKWYSTVEQAINNNPSAAKYTIVGDREADIYNLLTLYEEKKWDYVIRSAYNRRLSDGSKILGASLQETIDNWEVQHTYNLDLPPTKKRNAHQAKMEVKFGTVKITRPRDLSGRQLPKTISLQVVDVKEDPSTVVGKQKPVHWRIFTSHDVQTVEQALMIIKWYRWRWVIEQVFRTLKKEGLNLEKSEVESYQGLVNLATLALLAAVQVLQLVQARDGSTKQEAQTVFSDKEIDCLKLINRKVEGKTEKTKNPHSESSLAYVSWIIARLGGWKGYQQSRPPGPITMLRGLIRYYDTLQGYYLLI